MNTQGWIFLVFFWTALIIATYWSYRVMLSERHIPVGPLEEESHYQTCELDEKPDKVDREIPGCNE